MSPLGFIIAILSLLKICCTLSPIGIVDNVDKDRFKSVFDKASMDVKSVSLSVVGYGILEKEYPTKKEACELFKSIASSSGNTDDYYYATVGSQHISGCTLEAETIKNNLVTLENAKSTEELYKLVMIMKILKITLGNDIEKLTEKLSKKEGGVALSQAYTYQIMCEIVSDSKKLEKYFMEIEDTVQQADEADGKYLYYENKLEGTAFIVDSIVKLCDKYGKAPPISMDKMVKFANFLLSRRHTYKLSTAVEVVKALKSLSRNKYSVPIVVTAIDNGVIHPTQRSTLKISLNNLWGDQISELSVVADSVQSVSTQNKVITNRNFKPGQLPGVYELDMSLETDRPLTRGFYNILISINSADKRFEKKTSATIISKITTELLINSAEMSIKEKDQLTTGTLNYKLKMGVVLTEKLTLNWHHKLDFTFKIMDRISESVMNPHQVFIKMSHLTTGQEIIFVVECDKSNLYKFVLDLEKTNKDFDNISGEYDMQLIVGDPTVSSPIQWSITKIRLEMPGQPGTNKESSDENLSRRSIAGTKRNVPSPRIGDRVLPSQKKLISHMFRPAEKRGGQFISTIFTVLCVVPPFVIMLILWLIMGVNVSNFPFSLSSLLFHGGLVSIFGLYYCYWCNLNMFVTLRYLLLLGSITAFFGNRVLRNIAATNTQKQKTQ